MEQQTQGMMADQNDLAQNKGITFLSYIGILCLIPLLTKKESKFAQFHAKQGLVMLIGEVITPFIAIIPFIGWIVVPILWLFWIVMLVMGLMNVSKGAMKELPLIGKFGHKLNF